ncbi:MAG: hypothetical protein ACOX3A_04430 [bacterium]
MSRWGLLLTGAILFLLINLVPGWIAFYFPTISLWVLLPLLFALTKLLGDTFIALFWYESTWMFFRHFVRDTVLFTCLGVVAAVALLLAEQYIGGAVLPAIPAVFAYIFYLILVQREFRRK